jgi:CelD/BcsL family acetyltransferase involved in cellulose biosynthesis
MVLLTLNEIDPLLDARWVDLIERCGRSSVFHTRAWLEALRRTYGYTPAVFTDAAPGEPLRNALLFCYVDSWLTGRRLVALPFSDHCEPLLDTPNALSAFLESLKARVGRNCRYIELRPLEAPVDVDGFATSSVYCVHSIDLRPGLAAIFDGFHKNHTRRVIRRANRSGQTVEVGRSGALLEEFYSLHVMTRRRLGIPVQPFRWLQNLADGFGDQLGIYMARHEGQPAAAILTIRHKKTLVFKYGCLNTAHKRDGGTPPLFWKAIEDAKEQGLTLFDLGRSDMSHEGLLAFKDHLGGQRTTVTYYQYPSRSHRRWVSSLGKAIFALAPAAVQMRLSSRLYKHFG